MKLIKILSGVLLVFIIIKISLELFLNSYNTKFRKESITNQEINTIFLNSLNNFDISGKMIKKVVKNNVYNYYVNVYSDVPIELLLLELERNYKNKNVQIVAKDSVSNKRTIYKVFSYNNIILRCDFVVVDSLIRNKGYISFIIKSINPDEIENEILQSPEPLSFLIVPDKSFHKNLRLLKENNKKFYIMITDEIRDLTYKFNKNSTNLQTKITLYNILNDFDHSNKIFINNEVKWLPEQTLKVINHELKRNKISIYFTDTLIDLTDKDDLINRLNLEVIKINSGERKSFLITPKQYLELTKLFPTLRKTGYKIVDISLFLS